MDPSLTVVQQILNTTNFIIELLLMRAQQKKKKKKKKKKSDKPIIDLLNFLFFQKEKNLLIKLHSQFCFISYS